MAGLGTAAVAEHVAALEHKLAAELALVVATTLVAASVLVEVVAVNKPAGEPAEAEVLVGVAAAKPEAVAQQVEV